MMGLALKNVTLTLFEDSKAIFDEQGEMLFTHFGISGYTRLGRLRLQKERADLRGRLRRS